MAAQIANTYLHTNSVVVLEESPVLKDHREPIYRSLSLDHKVLEHFQEFCILKTVRYDHVTSVNFDFFLNLALTYKKVVNIIAQQHAKTI